jgi:hypothetical protein
MLIPLLPLTNNHSWWHRGVDSRIVVQQTKAHLLLSTPGQQQTLGIGDFPK